MGLLLRTLGLLLTVLVSYLLLACSVPFRLGSWIFTTLADVLFVSARESHWRLSRDVEAAKRLAEARR